MGIPLAEFGPGPQRAQRGGAGRAVYGIYRDSHPVCISWRLQAEVAAGLCRSIVATTSTRSLGPSPSGAAWCFRAASPTIQDCGCSRSWGAAHGFALFPISGAYGRPAGAGVGPRPSCFHGFDTATGRNTPPAQGGGEHRLQRAGALLLGMTHQVRKRWVSPMR